MNKTFKGLLIILILVQFASCKIPKPINPNRIADGFYIYDETETSLIVLTIRASNGQVHQIKVNDYPRLSVRSVYTYPFSPDDLSPPDKTQFQLNVISTEPNWRELPIFLVIDDTPYFEELSKSTGIIDPDTNQEISRGSIVFQVSNNVDVKAIEERLNQLIDE